MSARATLTSPISRICANTVQFMPTAMSLMKGTITYAMTPITMDRPNHCEKLAINPR